MYRGIYGFRMDERCFRSKAEDRCQNSSFEWNDRNGHPNTIEDFSGCWRFSVHTTTRGVGVKLFGDCPGGVEYKGLTPTAF